MNSDCKLEVLKHKGSEALEQSPSDTGYWLKTCFKIKLEKRIQDIGMGAVLGDKDSSIWSWSLFQWSEECFSLAVMFFFFFAAGWYFCYSMLAFIRKKPVT